MNEVRQIFVKFQNFFYDRADPRVRDKFLMGSPLKFFSIYLISAIFIVKIIPIFMADRKPIEFRKYYNYVDRILISGCLYFFGFGFYGGLFNYNWICQPIDRTNSVKGLLEVEICWQFLMFGFVYLLQNVIFAFSKRKNPHGRYLLIHHLISPVFFWICVNFYPGGHVSRIFDKIKEILMWFFLKDFIHRFHQHFVTFLSLLYSYFWI